MDRQPSQPSPAVLVATLDDPATGGHKAHTIGRAVSWTLNGRFVRSFRLDSAVRPLDSTPAVEHVVFARFGEADGAVEVALCLFRVDTLTIHYYSGEAFSIALPFGVRSAHPLQIGLLVQRRAADSADAGAFAADSADAGAFAASLPTLFSLLGPRSEFKMLGLSRAPDLDRMRRQNGRQLMLSPTPTRADGAAAAAAIPVFNDPNIVLVGTAASRRSRSAQFVLCWDTAARRHVVYQCVVVAQALEGDDDLVAESGSGTESTASQLSAIGSLSASRPRLARQASLSVQRRSSVAISAAAMASKRKSGYASAVKNDRRSSMLGRVSFNDSPGPNYAVDVFREQRQMRAEAVLQLCWSERRPRGDDRRGDGLNARVCVIQSVSGEDVICVLNGDTEVVVGVNAASLDEVFRHSARAAAPVCATRTGLDDLLLVSPSGSLFLALGDGGGSKPIPLPALCRGEAVAIDYTEGEWAALSTAGRDGHDVVSTRVRVSRLAAAMAAALSFVLSRSVFPLLWRCIVASLLDVASAGEEIERIALLLLHGSDRRSAPVVLPSRVKSELRDRAPAVLFALQLVYEDTALYRFEPPERLAAVGQLLVGFALQHAQHRAYQALLRTGHQPPGHVGSAPSSNRQRAADGGPAVLPSLSRWALAALDAPGASTVPFPTLGSIGTLFGIDDAEPTCDALASLRLLGVTADILYQLAADRDAALVLRRLAGDRAPQLLLQQLSPEMQWLVGAVAGRLQQTCLQSWPASVLALLGRHDMLANANGLAESSALAHPSSSSGSPTGGNAGGWHLDTGSVGLHGQSSDPRDIVELCSEVGELHAQRPPGLAGPRQSTEAHEFGLLAFGRDLRVDEAERLVDNGAAVHTASVSLDDDAADGESSAKELYLAALSRRVLALAPGQSLLRYSTRDLASQDALPIARPAVLAQFCGQKAASAWDPGDADTSWPLFHCGVSAALSIERDQLRQAHPSWVLLNWPAEPTLDADAADDGTEHKAFGDSLASHAGFLLGMGLLPRDAAPSTDGMAVAGRQLRNGPLCNMPPWQAFKYLSRRHGLTSIALLLGCACAHRGTMNGAVSKILSLHIPNLLPPGSSELMLLSYGTQAAAMLGLGVLFMRSQNRRMVEVMLHELASIRWTAHDGASDRLDAADPAESSAECYSLASGFALGLVALGRGMSARTLAGLHLLDSLSDAMNGAGASSTARMRGHAATAMSGGDVGAGNGPHEAALDMLDRMSISAPGGRVSELGAVAAIGLVFLGTNYDPAAQRLALPTAQQHLRSADPFTVLWKVLMQSLIMLDHIQPTPEWVESSVPRACASSDAQSLPPDLFRVRLHAVTAACFAMALKHVGTEDARAHATALAYFDEFEAVVGRPSLGYESSLTRAAAQSCLDAMGIAAALVVAGSGDVATMKRLRALHGASSGRTYGNHMASHMALGILFLGGGARFTISRSPESMALLLVALFPRFPQHFGDNHEHLQAWRHLWALCVVPRCLVVRDVHTGGMCSGAVVTLDGLSPDGASRSARVVPPVPFPSLAGVRTATVEAPGYLPVRVDLSPKARARGLLLKQRVLYMQPSTLVPPFSADAAPGQPMLRRYLQWLADAKTHVAAACEQLARADYDGLASSASLAGTVRAIEWLRICVLASRSALLATTGGQPAGGGGGGASGSWAEETYMAWLSVRSKIVEAGRTDEIRRVLARHWTGSQQPGALPGGEAAVASAVGILHAALDLPSPADAMELAKLIPLSQLADYVLA